MGPALFLGSCFSSNIGAKMIAEGFDVMVNPFGTIFNPASIVASIHRLQNPEPFTMDDCVQMGAGSDLWCSFNHYTKFARPTREEFLQNANAELKKAADFFDRCDTLVVTFGTAWCFRHLGTAESDPMLSQLFPGKGRIVSNCLKRLASEYSREMLCVSEIVRMFEDVCKTKKVIFTVSPIRHLADGAHGNQVSKSTLLLAADELSKKPGCSYFPSYEILIDELRDYSWYAADKVHPSEEAIQVVWERFAKSLK